MRPAPLLFAAFLLTASGAFGTTTIHRSSVTRRIHNKLSDEYKRTGCP